jgi:hypothetical protein
LIEGDFIPYLFPTPCELLLKFVGKGRCAYLSVIDISLCPIIYLISLRVAPERKRVELNISLMEVKIFDPCPAACLSPNRSFLFQAILIVISI